MFTYLIGVEPTAVTGPLAEFQHTLATKDETHQMVKTINALVDEERRLSDTLLDRAFNRCWPELEQQLNTLPAPQAHEPPPRKAEDMLQEVLEIVRDLAKSSPTSSASARTLRELLGLTDRQVRLLAELRYGRQLLLEGFGEHIKAARLDSEILAAYPQAQAAGKAPHAETPASQPETPNTSKPKRRRRQ